VQYCVLIFSTDFNSHFLLNLQLKEFHNYLASDEVMDKNAFLTLSHKTRKSDIWKSGFNKVLEFVNFVLFP